LSVEMEKLYLWNNVNVELWTGDNSKGVSESVCERDKVQAR